MRFANSSKNELKANQKEIRENFLICLNGYKIPFESIHNSFSEIKCYYVILTCDTIEEVADEEYKKYMTYNNEK